MQKILFQTYMISVNKNYLNFKLAKEIKKEEN